jgi:tyrosine-protein phosphatase SIW14
MVSNIRAGEDSEAVFREYHFYAGAKARLLDEAFIEQFDENTVLWMARRYGWVPPIEPPSPVSIQDSQ